MMKALQRAYVERIVPGPALPGSGARKRAGWEADSLWARVAIYFLWFVAGSFFGYIWMGSAFGLIVW